MNSDYKIVEKIIAGRLKYVLPKIVHTDQKAYIDQRQVADNICLMSDIIQMCEEIDQDGAIIMVYQSKACDRVEWEWLKLVMEKMGFGDRMTG